MERDERIDRLPKYARDYIARLEMRLREAKQTIREMQGEVPEARVWADFYGDHPRPLETADRPVRFGDIRADDSGWGYIDVRYRGPGEIGVHGGRGLIIRPEVSNGFIVQLDRR